MKISVLIVTLNSGRFLLDTVDSALRQKNADLEIIIKDGISTDNSLEAVPKDDRIHIISRKDAGIYDAMNQAIEYASGDVCIFMNCGDRFYNENVLEDVGRALSLCENQSNTIFYGDCYTANRDSILRYPDKFDDYMCFTKVLCHQATIYPISMLKNRGFSKEYKIAADYEYYVHAYTHGVNLVHIPVIVVSYQGGGASETKENRIKALEESKRIRKQNFPGDRYRKAEIKKQLHGIGIKQLLVRQEWFYPFYKKIAGLYYKIIIK